MKIKNTLYQTLALVLILFIPCSASMAKSISAFGGRDIVVPSTLPTGAIVARYNFTPMQACDKPTCKIDHVKLSNKGSIWSSVSGPDLETTVPGLSVRMLIDGVALTSSFKGTFSQTAEVQVFRNNLPLSEGRFSDGVFNSYFYLAPPFGDATFVDLSGKVTTVSGTCWSSNQTVKLSPTTSAQLPGVGMTTGATPFNLVINDCPQGFNRIGYSIQPVGGIMVGGSGTLPLLAGSSATGLAIRIVDASGIPLNPGVSLPVNEYNKNTGGSYKIPMSASYIQTSEKVTPGSVQAAMVVFLDYQ
ncbi:fimbrial protein [Pseudomonas sp. Q1-7]|uniref:fimbrial protein n=1 Tax=Pseudomonas sp. Q1-7 TaxID=3020843 RepID=UPI0023019FD3|nr:fimbrial protein [Pseudomonas sp. Q1-7]